MSGDRWIVVPNWDKFQHYRDRSPVWIKLYLELRDRDEWRELTDAQRGLLVRIWLEYAVSGGFLRVSKVRQSSPHKTRRDSLDSLQAAGFIEVSASRPLAQRREEKEKKEALLAKPVDNRAVLTKKAKAWLRNVGPNLDDVDLEYVLADQFKIDDPEIVADLIAFAKEHA